MMRKALVVATACAALVLVGVSAPGAVAGHAANDPSLDPGCNGQGYPHGIYDDAGTLGTFDLSFSPNTTKSVAGLSAGANLCGTDPPTKEEREGGAEGLLFKSATLTYPGVGEQVTCARPSPPVSQCDLDGDGAVSFAENISEGQYVGSAITDAYCTDLTICFALDMMEQADIPAESYVRYKSSGNDSCDETSGTTVACFQSEATLYPGTFVETPCDSDVVITRDNPATDPYVLTIYRPECFAGTLQLQSVYITNIDEITMCAYASATATCPTTGTTPLFRNGPCTNAGTRITPTGAYGLGGARKYTFTLKAKMTDGTSHTATRSGAWWPDWLSSGALWPGGGLVGGHGGVLYDTCK